jgi:hypothetical protein
VAKVLKTPAEIEAARRRYAGLEQNGQVWIRDFDEGIVRTLGAVIEDQRYWLKLELVGVDPPPGKPGVLVTFSFPESEFRAMMLPMILVRREDITDALQRWHTDQRLQYRTATQEARRVVVSSSSPVYDGLTGVDQVEQAQQAWPKDITYTLSVLARYRGATGQRGQVQAILKHVLRVYQPYGVVYVTDSLGDPRVYDAFQEGIAARDSIESFGERVIGFDVTVRVEGELDLAVPRTYRTVTQPPTLNFTQLSLPSKR